jgi:hypothetical protein
MVAKFIGVYSGRVQTDQPYEAQIGLVWDASFIDEIIAANIGPAPEKWSDLKYVF